MTNNCKVKNNNWKIHQSGLRRLGSAIRATKWIFVLITCPMYYYHQDTCWQGGHVGVAVATVPHLAASADIGRWWCPTPWWSSQRCPTRGCCASAPCRSSVTGGRPACADSYPSRRPTPGWTCRGSRSRCASHQTDNTTASQTVVPLASTNSLKTAGRTFATRHM